jgi:hypothetical protein
MEREKEIIEKLRDIFEGFASEKMDIHNKYAKLKREECKGIEDMMNELADAERHGELEDKLREIWGRAHASSWIYEYRHFIHVLHETAKEFGVEL